MLRRPSVGRESALLPLLHAPADSVLLVLPPAWTAAFAARRLAACRWTLHLPARPSNRTMILARSTGSPRSVRAYMHSIHRTRAPQGGFPCSTARCRTTGPSPETVFPAPDPSDALTPLVVRETTSLEYCKRSNLLVFLKSCCPRVLLPKERKN